MASKQSRTIDQQHFASVICMMPELAEVEWYRKQWDAGRGHKIVDVELHSQNRIFRGADTRELRRNLISQTFLSSQARGKRMLFKFSNDNWLGVHLGMTGKTYLKPAAFRPEQHDHLVLHQRERSLVFTDSRQFGRIRFHHGQYAPDWWQDDVPEIMARAFDQPFVDQFLRRHRKAPIKAVLLMQNGFCGVGNWMADEILWRAQILPSRLAGKLNSRQRSALLRATKFVVKRSLETLGRDFSDPPRGWLIHQKWRRPGLCPRHHTPLRHAIIGGRATAWCPTCQRPGGTTSVSSQK